MTGVLYLADSRTDRAAWEERRRGTPERPGLGASDVGHIMTSGADGWAALRHEKLHGSTFRGNAATVHGNDREPHIADFARRRYGLEPNSILFGRADDPEAMATPDGISIDGKTLGEYKTTVEDWPTSADVPRDYFWQMVWQRIVCDAERSIFIFETHENGIPLYPEPRVFIFERDEKDDARALKQVQAWRDNGDPDLVLPDWKLELNDLLITQAPLERRFAAAKEAQEAGKERIRALLAEHADPDDGERFEGTGMNVSYLPQKPRSTFDAAAFRERYPAAAKRFQTATPQSPRLTITTRKK